MATGAAFAALFSTRWQFAELWNCCVVSCKALRWIYTFCYIINSSFVYTIIWIHQRNLYSDPKLPESKQKCIKAFSTALLVAIQLTIVVGVGALMSRFRLIQTDFGCVYDRETIGLYRKLLPISIKYAVASSVRRILKWGGGGGGGGGGAGNLENLRMMKSRMKIFPPRISPFSCPKSDDDQKKKDLHSNLVRFLAQNWVKPKKESLCPPFVC